MPLKPEAARPPKSGSAQLGHAAGVNQPLRFFKRFLAAKAIEFDRNHVKRLVLARRFDLTAIGFGNYRSPQSIGSLEGADGEPFVVSSAVSIGWHGATGAACPCWQLGFASSQMADGDDDAARSPAVFSMGCLWVCPSL